MKKPLILISQLKSSVKELGHFLKRDLQDYRWEDYQNLSGEARRTLLFISSLLLMAFLFIVWRYFWGSEFLQQYEDDQRLFQQKVKLLSQDVRLKQQFIESESTILFQKLLLVESAGNLQEAALSETLLMQLVESRLQDHELRLIRILPKKSQLIWMPQKRSSLRGKAHSLLSQDFVLGNLQTAPQELFFANHHSETNIGEQTFVPMLEISLNICGEYHSLLSFLTSIQQQLSKTATLLYLSQLEKVESKANQCYSNDAISKREKSFDLKLQFYDFLALKEVVVTALKSRESDEIIRQFPETLPALAQMLKAQVLEAEMASEAQSSREVLKSHNSEFAVKVLFQEVLEEGDQQPELSLKVEGQQRYWYIGETYQGSFLSGIIFREQEPFAIIREKDGSWQTRRIGEYGIVVMTPDYIELASP